MFSDEYGPFQLVVPGEKRAARWVRQLKVLRVEPLPTSTAYDSEQARWIVAHLDEIQSIRVGITRKELLKVFMEEGGISNRRQRRYVYRNCGYIKVDVEFAPASDLNSHEQKLDDRITKISKPFLERVGQNGRICSRVWFPNYFRTIASEDLDHHCHAGGGLQDISSATAAGADSFDFVAAKRGR